MGIFNLNSFWMKERKKLVMFDMDGVLFDTMPRHARAWNIAFSEVGHFQEESSYYLHEGRNGKGTVEAVLGPGADWEAIYRRKTEVFASLPEGGLIPGTHKVAEIIHGYGIPALVVTGSGQAKSLVSCSTLCRDTPEPGILRLVKSVIFRKKALIIFTKDGMGKGQLRLFLGREPIGRPYTGGRRKFSRLSPKEA